MIRILFSDRNHRVSILFIEIYKAWLNRASFCSNIFGLSQKECILSKVSHRKKVKSHNSLKTWISTSSGGNVKESKKIGLCELGSFVEEMQMFRGKNHFQLFIPRNRSLTYRGNLTANQCPKSILAHRRGSESFGSTNSDIAITINRLTVLKAATSARKLWNPNHLRLTVTKLYLRKHSRFLAPLVIYHPVMLRSHKYFGSLWRCGIQDRSKLGQYQYRSNINLHRNAQISDFQSKTVR